MRGRRPLPFVALLTACGAAPGPVEDLDGKAPATLQEALDGLPGITVAPSEPVPGTLVLLNDTDKTVVLDRSFGPAAPFALHPQRGESLSFDDVDDAQTGGGIATCQCTCDAAPCPECEPPLQVRVSLAPGERTEVAWNGQVRTYDGERDCFPRKPAPSGPARVSACAEEGPCVSAEVTLPTAEPITLRWSSLGTATSCSEVDPLAAKAATEAFRTGFAAILRDRPVATCDASPRCVEESALEAAFAEYSHPACASLVVPRGDRLDVYLYLPLPEGSVGGARFRQTWDLDGLRLLDARYPQ